MTTVDVLMPSATTLADEVVVVTPGIKAAGMTMEVSVNVPLPATMAARVRVTAPSPVITTEETAGVVDKNFVPVQVKSVLRTADARVGRTLTATAVEVNPSAVTAARLVVSAMPGTRAAGMTMDESVNVPPPARMAARVKVTAAVPVMTTEDVAGDTDEKSTPEMVRSPAVGAPSSTVLMTAMFRNGWTLLSLLLALIWTVQVSTGVPEMAESGMTICVVVNEVKDDEGIVCDTPEAFVRIAYVLSGVTDKNVVPAIVTSALT